MKLTVRERIFREAEKAFGRPAVYQAWPQIDARVDHAFWDVWNEKYGPLNQRQREFAGEVVCRALQRVKKDGQNPNHKYALFHALIGSALNHESIDRGFKSRGDDVRCWDDGIQADLGDLFKAVPA